MKKLFKVAVVAVGLFLTGASVNAQKLGHIDSGTLLQSMPEMKAADASFKTFQEQKENAIKQMDAERQKKIAAYQDKSRNLSEANKETLGKELEALVKEIQDMEKRITESQQKAQQELQAKNTELYQPLYKKAEDAIKAVSKEKGYAYVFDVSQPGVVYFDGGDDILKLVQAKLGITATSTAAAPKK